MHAPVLMLVTAFAASVAAAPLPVTPIESPVEGLAVRDAEAALSQAQMDMLKRSIFEKLEEIVPVKRDEIHRTGGEFNDKRWRTTTESDKRAFADANNAAADKRAFADANNAAADKRAFADANNAATDKRAFADANNAAADKRAFADANNAAAD